MQFSMKWTKILMTLMHTWMMLLMLCLPRCRWRNDFLHVELAVETMVKKIDDLGKCAVPEKPVVFPIGPRR